MREYIPGQNYDPTKDYDIIVMPKSRADFDSWYSFARSMNNNMQGKFLTFAVYAIRVTGADVDKRAEHIANYYKNVLEDTEHLPQVYVTAADDF